MRERVVTAALSLILVAGLSGCGPVTTHNRAAALPDHFAAVWSAGIESNLAAGGVAANVFAFTAAAIVLPAASGDLTVRDPGTGQVRWSAAPDPGWIFAGDEVIGGRLYAYQTTPNVSMARFVAYDLRTGQVVWRTDLGVFLYRGIGLAQVMFTSRGIVVQLGAANALYGLRLSDGKGAWAARLPANCPSGTSTATPSTAVFLLECTGTAVLLDSVDPATGRITWQHVLAVSRAAVYPIDLDVPDAVDVIAEFGNTMRSFTLGGRLIATRECFNSSCIIGSVDSVGVLKLGTNFGAAQGVDLATGQPRWRRPGDLAAPGSSSVGLGSDGLLFALAGPAFLGSHYEFLPAFVVAMQAATGRTSLVPLPEAATAGGSILAGAADGLLFVQSAGSRGQFVTAFRPEHVALAGPVALGGVAPAQWPDACALLTPADLRFIAPDYVSSPRPATISGVTWPRPVTCAYVGPSAGDPAITLTVAWVAASAAQASELLASDLAIIGSLSQPPPRIPGGYLVYDGAINGGVDRALVVSGRAIVEVTVPGNPRDAVRIAPIVAARLRDTPP